MKITRIEKLVLALIAVCLVSFVASVYTLAKQVEEVGLKSIVEQLWCGKDGCTK
jgi:hypothetical protein